MKQHAYSSKHYLAEDATGEDGGKIVRLTYDDGYKSSVPLSVFRRDFRQNGELSFGDALVALESGKRVARSGWNGKGMWLKHIEPHSYNVTDYNALGYEKRPFIIMRDAVGAIVPWLASQTDVLAKDWSVLDLD